METNKTSVYLKIVDEIKRRIALGIAAKDERLPSCRELALELGVNPNTVQRAYSTLEEEWIIYTIPKKGVYVGGGNAGDIRRLALEKIAEFKAAGLSREDMEKILTEVYGRS